MQNFASAHPLVDMSMNLISQILRGGQDIELAVISTAELSHTARELSELIKNREAVPSADVESIEPLKGRLAKLVDEIKRRNWRRSVTADVPMPTPEQLAVIGEETFFTFPEGLKEQIAELQAGYERTGAEMMKYIPAQATKDFLAHEAKLQELANSGASLAEHVHKSRDDFYNSFRDRVNALRKAQASYVGKARELVAPVVESFKRDLAETVARRETAERDTCARYLVPFRPSPQLLLCMRTLLAIEDGQFFAGGSPAQLAAFIGQGHLQEDNPGEPPTLAEMLSESAQPENDL
jgi:hypothetical protein